MHSIDPAGHISFSGIHVTWFRLHATATVSIRTRDAGSALRTDWTLPLSARTPSSPAGLVACAAGTEEYTRSSCGAPVVDVRPVGPTGLSAKPVRSVDR
jgi:hypothetical protein